MGILKLMRQCAEKLTGTRIYRTLPRGIDPFFDLSKAFPNRPVKVIFDIGANIGQTAVEIRKFYPYSQILCFEPVKSTYEILRKKLKSDDKAQAYQLGFGPESTEAQMIVEEHSDMSRLIDSSEEENKNINKENLETVKIETLDNFCKEQGIDHIDILKIDTEGHDLDVLKGAMSLFHDLKIDVVELEAGMYPGNARHVPFEALKSFMEDRGYLLFGIYEQVDEWTTKSQNLRRVNPVFISPRLISKECQTQKKAA